MKPAILALVMPLAPLAAAGPVADFIVQAHVQAAPSLPAASRSLQTMQKLSALEADERFGLPPMSAPLAPSVSRSRLQPIYEIDLLKLRTYDPLRDPSALLSLSNTRRVLYLVDTTPPSAVEVTQKNSGDWVTFRLGQMSYAQLVRTTIGEDVALTPEQTIIVEIPALQLRFIAFARFEDGVETLMLASVVDAPELSIAQGVARSAREVLLSLRDVAMKHDGMPT